MAFSCEKGVSIYFDMFKAGKEFEDLELILAQCRAAGIIVRQKDVDNYFRGRGFSDREWLKPVAYRLATDRRLSTDMAYSDYEKLPDYWIENPVRFFPTEGNGSKPLYGWKWGDNVTSKKIAEARSPVGMVGENMIGQPYIVLDIDGDHDKDNIDYELLKWFSPLKKTTESWQSRDESFHLVWKVDRLIPTMHFPRAHLDILGNARNQARYYKDKQPNGVARAIMTDEAWDAIKHYIRYRQEK
jgi:hypothetical protein